MNPIPRLAMVNDLAGFGRCSTTVSLPVISALQVQVCPVPTSILSNHLGFPTCYFDDYTEHIRDYVRGWEKLGITFDGLYCGFLGSVAQIEIVEEMLDSPMLAGALFLLDPVMGDHGKAYSTITSEHILCMKRLLSRAHILTPNLTEACLLTDTPYRKEGWTETELASLCEKLADISDISDISETSGVPETSGTSAVPGTSGASAVPGTSGTSAVPETSGASTVPETSGTSGVPETSSVPKASGASGVPETSGTSGVPKASYTFPYSRRIIITGIPEGNMLCNALWEGGHFTLLRSPVAGASRPGTGDLFASILAADALNGITFERSVQRAADFVALCIQGSEEAGIPIQEGVIFEKYMSRLFS